MGRVPAEKVMHYETRFSVTTSRKGRIKLTLDEYEKATSEKKISNS